MKPADFLPSFFKQVKRAVVPGHSGANDYLDEANDPLKPAISAQNLLGPEVQKPVIAPAVAPSITVPAIGIKPTIPYRVPLPAPELAVPAAETVRYPNLPRDVAREMGHVVLDRRGRPQPLDSVLEPPSDEKTIATNKAYQNYDPSEKPAKGWRKWVPTMISGALRGFAAGGPGGAIFGAAEGGIGGALDPARANREWQRKKLGETSPIVAGIQKDRRAQADIEEQQAQTAQRLATPAIAAAELARKAAYDRSRLEIQRDVAAGRISSAEATRKLREAEIKQRGDEGRLNRESREKIAGMRPNATDAAAAEGEALATSTAAAAAEIKRELDQHKGQLIENERAITRKEALWRSEAAKIVDDDLKMSEALERVKAADPDFASGAHDQTVNNTKALREAIADKEKRHATMQDDIRKGSAKASRRARGASAPTSHSFSIGAYRQRNKGATDADAKAFAAKNYAGYAVVP